MDSITYEDYEGLVHDRVISFARSTRVPQDELLSEAMFQFVRARDYWKPDGGAKFSHFLYRFLDNQLINFSKRWNRSITFTDYTGDSDREPEVVRELRPDRSLEFREEVGQLSVEARYVVTYLIDGHGDALGIETDVGEKNVKRRVVSEIRTHLVDECEMTKAAAKRVLAEIKNLVRSF